MVVKKVFIAIFYISVMAVIPSKEMGLVFVDVVDRIDIINSIK